MIEIRTKVKRDRIAVATSGPCLDSHLHLIVPGQRFG